MNDAMFLPESLHKETGKPIGPGEVGELVLSNLCCETAPLLRYKTGDLVRFVYEPCGCGRTFRRMDGGVIGRADDMFHFGGVNIFPSAIENFIRQVAEFSNEYQLVVPRQGSGKRLVIRVEPASSDVSRDRLKGAVKKFQDAVAYNVKITPDVEIAQPGSLPRFEGKARRIIRED